MAKFCSNCGKEIDNNSTVCLNCGVLQGNNTSNKQNNKKKKGLPIWAIVLIVVGSILLLPLLIFLLGILFTVNIYTQSSSTQTVQEELKQTLSVEVTFNPEFKCENVDYDKLEIKITGDNEKVKKVYLVKGIVDLNDIDNLKNGINTIETDLKAYDINGNEVDVILNPEKVTVRVTLSGIVTEEIQTKEIEDIQIETRGLEENLKASAIGENSTHVTVLVSGTKNELEDINKENITAYVDLAGLGVG